MRKMAIAYCIFPGLGLERFRRNLPTAPARTVQLPEGREPIFQQPAAGDSADLLPALTSESRVSGSTRIIERCASGRLEGRSIWGVGCTFSVFSNDDVYANNNQTQHLFETSIRSSSGDSTMSRGHGSLLNVWRLDRRGRQVTLSILVLAAGLFLLGPGSGFAQTGLMGSAPETGIASPVGVGTESIASPCLGRSSSSNSTFDGGGLTALSGLSPLSGVSSSGIGRVPAACSTATGTSLSNDASAIAGINTPLGATQLGSDANANPMGSVSAAASAGAVPSTPCIGADSPALIAPSLTGTGSMGISSSSSGTGSSGRIPGSRIIGMGGTGEIPDPLNATNDDGISDHVTSCPGGPFGVMQLNLMGSATAPVTSTTTPMASMSSGTNLSSSGIE
jgi:hypothetical protein